MEVFSGDTWRELSSVVREHGIGPGELWVQNPSAPLKCYVTLGKASPHPSQGKQEERMGALTMCLQPHCSYFAEER